MATQNREPVSALEQALLQRGPDFSFFQGVRLLRSLQGERRAGSASLYLRPHLSLAFSGLDIQRIQRRADGAWVLSVNGFGLYGTWSPLPTYYTEDLLEEERQGRRAMREFLDILHNALYPLLIDAWTKSRLAQRVIEHEHAEPLNWLFGLIGLFDPRQRGALRPHDAGLLRFAPMLQRLPRSASGLQNMLQSLLPRSRARVDPCRQRETPIPPDQCTRLGMLGHNLGANARIGRWIDDRSSSVGICLGELSARDFQRLLPGTELGRRLAFLARHHVREPFFLHCELRLRHDARVPGTRLRRARWCRLGLDAWLAPATGLREASTSFALDDPS